MYLYSFGFLRAAVDCAALFEGIVACAQWVGSKYVGGAGCVYGEGDGVFVNVRKRQLSAGW